MGILENTAKALGLRPRNNKVLDAELTKAATYASVVDSNRGWFPLIRESFAGAWQQNVEVSFESVLSFSADFACRTLIASDISKLPINLVQYTADDIYEETQNAAYSPVLRKPNHYQNRMQFLESWMLSKLQNGNTYILKRRDNRNVVNALYVLDPRRVTVLVSESGDVFYRLDTDQISGVMEFTITVPASEIIHDRFNCFFHPLVGLSPIFASGLAATQGLAIQNASTRFFQNGSNPGGILVAPGAIADETAARLKTYWEENFSGRNRGKIAVLGDGLKFEQMSVKANDSQLIEQLKWSSEVVCSTYHVPPYKIGVGQLPSFNNVQALNVEYYSQCLQVLIEAVELCLTEGLGMSDPISVKLGVENLLRMDSVSLMETLDKGTEYYTPNEGRKRLNLKPVEGGDSVLRQEQNFSLEALAKRDAQQDPFASGSSASAPAPAATDTPAPDSADNDNVTAAEANKALAVIWKGLR